ncbi:bifunctional 4-hydroxy-2-oxoglutarate aldolase/2-dehydro-3-deoxy-phosphogluconate aldolase [Synechococcus sp. EJ6-Ellesmere]|uniref:bifunctional 4-hydroxy-2-oxoglutarate aldolase/2-dehydro-3-deoxy-phosphogluconate aldolase n=1 Tax=Synechococcus sp. EJ6-Ellesmere TaxID=2823734 RepID=UPI0020CE7DF0|nr:bifunctional 4-hydroxy-2-oxoglutarate aldolase/2-dehydro-3-deoxy-phosphogluconate aldolase [Synechococcus sp. EJ6-Ellesmere]MCP9826168.1 bifunctional 4-hydroxy-2-oxoglutarate aldolase/2-dehydro-3-deoxy-phosphogluconate aldolase [Synechococcus sp. EJ6-Ellesmere]
MCGSLSTSESQTLLDELRALPLLAVLRPVHPLEAVSRIALLSAAGIRHVEIAWSPWDRWSHDCLELAQRFPAIRFGAASVRTIQALEAAHQAGFSFAFSPVLDPFLLSCAYQLGITLVPGVFSPTEVQQAVELGCAAVKLFPAKALGPGYWGLLAGALAPLPFCIAAGGLEVADLSGWLQGGADALALGSTLFEPISEAGDCPRLDPRLAGWVAAYTSASSHQRLH